MKNKRKSVYLDVCALCRPYDEQGFMRIKIESTAVQLIIVYIRAGEYVLYYSPVHLFEIDNNPDEIVRADLTVFLDEIGKNIKPLIIPEILEKRGRTLIAAGFGVADAMHIAHAEQVQASFITCDDRLLKKCRSLDIKVWYGTPVEFCKKERLI